MGSCADKNCQAKPSLSLKSQAMGLDQPQGLDCIITFGGQGPKSPKIKLAELKKYGVLAEIAKFNAHRFFPLYGIPTWCIPFMPGVYAMQCFPQS